MLPAPDPTPAEEATADAPQPQAANAEPQPEPERTPPPAIGGEAYVVALACFEAFAAGGELAPATIRNRVVRLGRHRQRASRSGTANIFRAAPSEGSRVESEPRRGSAHPLRTRSD